MNEPTEIANFLLMYALKEKDHDKILDFTYQLFEPCIDVGILKPNAIRAIQKEVGKALEIQHHLARMIHRIPTPDPNEQLEIFDKERTTPDMWNMRDLDHKDGQ